MSEETEKKWDDVERKYSSRYLLKLHKYTYFSFSSSHSASLSLLSESEGKCVPGNVGYSITIRDRKGTEEEEGKQKKKIKQKLKERR